MTSIFPEAKLGLSVKVIIYVVVAALYSLGLVKATDSTEEEVVKIKVEMGVMGNNIDNIKGDISEIKNLIQPRQQTRHWSQP